VPVRNTLSVRHSIALAACVLVTALAAGWSAYGEDEDTFDEVRDAVQEIVTWRSYRDYERAASAYGQARRLDPEYLFCTYERLYGVDAILFDIYDRSLRPDVYGPDARRPTFEELNVVLDRDPFDPVALRERGLIYIHVGAFGLAYRDFERAIRTDPHPEQAKALRALASGSHIGVTSRDNDNPATSLDNLDSAMSDGTGGVALYFARGLSLEKLGYFTEAFGEFDLVIAALPNDPSDPNDIWLKTVTLHVRANTKAMIMDPTWEEDFDAYLDISETLFRAYEARCQLD